MFEGEIVLIVSLGEIGVVCMKKEMRRWLKWVLLLDSSGGVRH